MPGLDWVKRAYRPAREVAEASAPKEQGLKKVAIMIVDDNIKIIDALKDVLQGTYLIVPCCSAAEVELRFNSEIKLVLLDIKMSPDDGLVIFSQLRKKSEQVPIIFHTAYPGNSDVVDKMRELSADGFLMKGDYSLAHLEKTIERALGRRRSSGAGT